MKVLNEVHSSKTCPACGESMEGGDICQHFIDEGYSQEKAEETAAMFGWTKENKRCFQKVIGLETSQYDGCTWWLCPKCNTAWKRFDWSEEKYLSEIILEPSL